VDPSDPAAHSGPVDLAAVAGPDPGSGRVAGAAAAPAGLAAADSGPWSDRAAVFPGYAAGIDPACRDPAARPHHADSGALGPWSRLSVRAAIGPASVLAWAAAIALACHARAGSRWRGVLVFGGLHRRVAPPRLAFLGRTPRHPPPIAQPY